MNFLGFIKSPVGNLTMLGVFIAVGGFLVYRSNAREQARTAQLTRVESTEAHPLRESILRVGQVFKAPPRVSTSPTAPAPAAPLPNDPPNARATKIPRPEPSLAKPRALPISLITAPASDPGNPLSKTYAPFGRMIPCETIITVESSHLDTPVIGLVTEDVWHNGELIIPAGAEVHGRAALDRSRERIAASGKWVVVWRDSSALNGTELVLNGIALDRAKDDTNGEFGMRDGSAGLIGDLVKSDDWQEIKLFASTFLSGFAGGLQTLQNQGTTLGLTQIPVATSRNAALQGTADVLNTYAKQIQEAIARDGFYVRVPAGKQFYLYVTETIDVAKGTRGNIANTELWRKPHEN